jgi:hypothetical protein
MAAARQGLPVRLDRARQRGAAFALARASRRARTRSIGSRSRARGLSLIFDHPPSSLPRLPLALLVPARAGGIGIREKLAARMNAPAPQQHEVSTNW